jgi:hypothetical protein
MECDAVGTFSRRPCILTVAMKARLARSSEHADEPQSLIIRLACPDGYMATLRAGVPRIFDRIGPRLPAVGNGQLSATTGAQKLASCRSLRLMDFMCLSGAVVEVLVLEPDCCRKGLGTRLLTHARSLRGPLSVDENEQIESLCTLSREWIFSTCCHLKQTGTSTLPSTLVQHQRRADRDQPRWTLDHRSDAVDAGAAHGIPVDPPHCIRQPAYLIMEPDDANQTL